MTKVIILSIAATLACVFIAFALFAWGYAVNERIEIDVRPTVALSEA